MSDFSSVLIWWFVNLLLGLISLPITTLIFKNFFDRGYLFSKIIGIIFSSYIVWLGASFHILPFNRLIIILTILGLTIINLWIYTSRHKNTKDSQLPWKWFIFEELLFLAALASWSYVKATEPSIRGLEKFMDFGFVNSILRGNSFPPLDMWLTKSPDYTGGYFINYYYFGHYITAFLTKLSGIDSAITYNLMIATLFAYTFSLSFSIGANLYHLFNTYILETGEKNNLSEAGKNFRRSHTESADLIQPRNLASKKIFTASDSSRTRKLKYIIVGLLAAFLVSLGGNLHTLYVFTTNYPNESPQPPWKLELGFHPERYWYPNATRFIPFTIHEFPLYSFVVSDLHGHVSDIPLVLTSLALLLVVITNSKKKSAEPKTLYGNSIITNFLSDFREHTSIPFFQIALLGTLLAMMYMTNAWDGLIYMIFAILVFLFINFRNNYSSIFSVLYKTFSAALFLLFFFLIANLPFSFNFKPFVSGIGVLCAPAFLLGKDIGPFLFEVGKCQKSPLYQLATLWGFFYFNILAYFIFVIFPKLGLLLRTNGKIILSIKQKTGQILKDLKDSNPVDMFIILLIFISTLLLIFPEYFYMKDIYPAHYRANTMFKLGYQAFMMLGLISSFILARISISQKGNRAIGFIIYRFFFMILFTLVAIYPYFAINSYFGNLKTYHGLFGLNWMETQYPDDYKAVAWIRKNINCSGGEDCNNQPVIAEANGDSYTDYARVSANTGLPTIIGWPVHEWLWRGSYDEAGRRIPEVTAIYESKDINQTKEILKKYRVEYIFVGQLEREKYKNLNMEKIQQLGKVVFESGETKIFKITQF